jgi:hypothetical protein
MTVTIISGPNSGSTSTSAHASFGFRTNVFGARFACSLDGGAYSRCTSPASYSGLANGRHTFSVVAVEFGLSSRAASVGWEVDVKQTTTPKPSTPPVKDTTPPSVASDLVATAGNAQVVLTWDASTDNVGVAGYWVLRDGSAVAQVTGTTYTDHDVTNGTAYSYTVEAYDAAGNISAQSAVVLATPLAPSTPPLVTEPPPPPPVTGGNPPPALTSWVPATNGFYTPLSDAAAAADVTAEPENRPANTAANDYTPTAAQLQAFHTATDPQGQTGAQLNPYDQFVTGHYAGTTDEIIQWAAWKWGIPADWLRAEYVKESRWTQSALGDLATVTPAVYDEYPPQARVPGTDEVYTSMGITGEKWIPDSDIGIGTEPLRWESTAFNIDYQAATLRFYYDNPDGLRSAWGDSTYSAGNAWASLGGWFEPYPWLNAGQLSYIADVQADLADRAWAQPGF